MYIFVDLIRSNVYLYKGDMQNIEYYISILNNKIEY